MMCVQEVGGGMQVCGQAVVVCGMAAHVAYHVLGSANVQK